MQNVKTTVILDIMGELEPSQNNEENTKPCNRKAKNKGTTDNSHIGHCPQASKSANVKVQKVKHGK